MARLTSADYISAFRADSAALAIAARKAGPDTPVRSCPGWYVADLVSHVWTFVSSLRTGEWNEPANPRDIDPDAYETACHALLEAWEQREPRGARRCANEISVHRWDAQNAIDTAEPIGAALAADGIHEFFRVFVAPPAFGGGKGTGEALRIDPTDAELDVVVRFERDGLQWGAPEDERPVGLLRGAASDVQLFLWGRLPLSALDLSGDDTAAVRLQSPRFK